MIKLFFSFLAGCCFASLTIAFLPTLKGWLLSNAKPFGSDSLGALYELSSGGPFDMSVYSHDNVDLMVSNSNLDLFLKIREDGVFGYMENQVTYSDGASLNSISMSNAAADKYVMYNFYDSNGNYIGLNADGNIDGTIDLKLRDNKSMVQIDNQWFELTRINDKQAVLIGGEPFKLENISSFEYAIGEKL